MDNKRVMGFIKKGLVALLLLGTATAKAQIHQEIHTPYDYDHVAGKKSLLIPTGCGTPTGIGTLLNNKLRRAAFYWDTCAKKLYTFSPNDSTWNEAGSGSGATPPGVDEDLIINDEGAFGVVSDVKVNKALKRISADSFAAIKARATIHSYNPTDVIKQFNADSVVVSGHSIMFGSNASPSSNNFASLIGTYLGKPVRNWGVAGTGDITAVSKLLRFVNPGHNALTAIMASLNDWRDRDVDHATAGPKTRAKHYNTLLSVFWNSQQKNNINPTSGSGITRNGTWGTNWDGSTGGGKNVSLGAYTSSNGAYIEYAFTDSTVGFRCFGGDGSGGTHLTATVEVRIDGVLVETFSTNNQTDGENDGGGLDYQYIPVTKIYSGLTNAAHTIRITNITTDYFLIDGFFNLLDASEAKWQLWFHEPHMQMSGYAGGQLTIAKTDQMNARTDSLKGTIHASYRDRIVICDNSLYDTVNSNDGVHPDNAGHYQIFQSATLSFVTPVDGPALVYDSVSGRLFLYIDGLPYEMALKSETDNAITNTKDSSGYRIARVATATTNFIPKWENGSNKRLTNSAISDDGSAVAIGRTLNITGGNNSYGSSAGVGVGSRTLGTIPWLWYVPSTELNLYDVVGGVARMVFKNTGETGIGTITPAARLHTSIDDGTTNVVVYPFMISHETNVTNANGSGVGMNFRNENSGNAQIITSRIVSVYTDVTGSAEKADLVFYNVRSGTLTEGFRLNNLGEIVTGAWRATTVAVDKGGTGQTSYTDGQLLIGNSSGNTLTKATLTAGAGIGITNGGGSITIAVTGTNFNSSTYLPTLTDVANGGTLTANTCRYRQIGDEVEVWGYIGIDPTTTATITTIGMSLPVASTFVSLADLIGTGFSDSVQQGFAMKADVANSRATIEFNAIDISSANYFFRFSYKVTPP